MALTFHQAAKRLAEYKAQGKGDVPRFHRQEDAYWDEFEQAWSEAEKSGPMVVGRGRARGPGMYAHLDKA